MKLLSPAERQSLPALLPEWGQEGETLVRTWVWPSFAAAIAFVGRVAVVAEQEGHHPDIVIRYTRVTLTLTTHEAGGLTTRDLALARRLSDESVP